MNWHLKMPIRWSIMVGSAELMAQNGRMNEDKHRMDSGGYVLAPIESRLTPAQLAQLTESLPHLVWTCLAEGPCDYLSRQWVEYTGVPESEQLGYRWLEQIHPDDVERVKAEWAATVGEERSFEIEFRIRRADGVYRWFKTRAIPLRDADGRLVKWYGSNMDADDYKAAMQGLVKKNELLAQEIQRREAIAAELAESMKKLEIQAQELRDANERISQELAQRAAAEAERAALQEEIIAMQRDRAQTELEQKMQVIARQEEVIRNLETPIIEVWDKVLTLPMVGTVDSRRAACVMDNLLRAVTNTQAQFAILDLTGVDVVDTATAHHLIAMIRAIRLLGAEGIITGIRPNVAQTVITLGLDLSSIISCANLRQGLAFAIRHMAKNAR